MLQPTFSLQGKPNINVFVKGCAESHAGVFGPSEAHYTHTFQHPYRKALYFNRE
jgi:hypothetical protein